MWTISQCTVSTKDKKHSEVLASAHRGLQVLKARNELGFYQITERDHLWTSSEARAKEIRKNAHCLAVLGMGGSSLGGRALMQSLKNWNATHHVEFLDNVDAERFWKWLKSRTNLQDTHWVIVSKSGNTIETLTMAEFVDQHLRLSGFKKLGSCSTVISEIDDNPLVRWAKKEGIPALEIPKDVGGRFSVLTPVGLLPAAFYGLNLEELRAGARWALGQDDLIAELATQSMLSFDRNEWITLFWAYADGLREFGFWIQQLWAESLGKATGRDGAKARRASTPIPAIGSSDQHSILQQVMDGPRDKFLWFMRVKKSETDGPTLERNLFDCQSIMQGKSMGDLFGAMATATRTALEQQGIQSVTIETEKLDERSLGALFMIFELVVGTIGEQLGINAFDQPGVEAGKRIARDLLSR